MLTIISRTVLVDCILLYLYHAAVLERFWGGGGGGGGGWGEEALYTFWKSNAGW